MIQKIVDKKIEKCSCNDKIRDLLRALLKVDAEKRLSAKEALQMVEAWIDPRSDL